MGEERSPCLHFAALQMPNNGGKILRVVRRLNEPLVTALRVNHHNRTRVIHRVGAWFFVWDFSKGNVHLLGKVNRRFMRAGHPHKGGIERCEIPTKLIWIRFLSCPLRAGPS